MIHSFDADVAMVVGVKAAILLHHIAWWCKKNEANEINCHDGEYWTYNSSKAYSKLFPFWSSDTIRKELKKLEQDEYIKTGCFNRNPTDRTKWFTITDKGRALIGKEFGVLPNSIRKNSRMDSADFPNPFGQKSESTIIHNKTNSIKHSNKRASAQECSPELAEALSEFEEHRKKLKKPMTGRAKELLLSKLTKLARTEQEQIAILNQSIMNGWIGIFPIGGDRRLRQGKQSAADMADDVIRMMSERGMLDDTGGAEDDNADAGGVPSWFSE